MPNTIRIFVNNYLMKYTNKQKIIDVTGNTVFQRLQNLISKFPGTRDILFDKNGNLIDYVEIYINKESAEPEPLILLTQPGDQVHILFTIDGGW